MKESTLSAKMAKRVRERGGWCRKVAGGPYGAGWPDLMGCYREIALGLEVKLPTTRNTVTDLQRATLEDMRAAGALAVMVSSMKGLDYVLDCIDHTHGLDVWITGSVIGDIGLQARMRVDERRARTHN